MSRFSPLVLLALFLTTVACAGNQSDTTPIPAQQTAEKDFARTMEASERATMKARMQNALVRQHQYRDEHGQYARYPALLANGSGLARIEEADSISYEAWSPAIARFSRCWNLVGPWPRLSDPVQAWIGCGVD